MNYENEINYIMKLIDSNTAYLIYNNGLNNTYICARYNYFQPKQKPIMNNNSEISEYLEDDQDFIIWYPNDDDYSIDTPWGKGKPSANLYVCCIYN